MSDGGRSESGRTAEGVIGTGVPSAAVVDLIALLAYGELQAFDQMAADARLAPDLRRRAVLSEMAAAEIGHFRVLAQRLVELGVEPAEAMEPFAEALRAFHEQTQPRDWLEALAKAYVRDGVADDFYREVVDLLGPHERPLVVDVLHDTRYADYAEQELREAITADPKVANRMSMWARRLVGEGLSQAQRVAEQRPALAAVIIAGSGDQAGVLALFRRLTMAHTDRMNRVGLNN